MRCEMAHSHRERNTGSDPYPEEFPPDWSMATVVP